MIEVINGGDIFQSKCDSLVNPVNCVGVMGAGLAKEFKIRYPHNYNEYKRACANGQVEIGRCQCVPEDNKVIINLPTKTHWRNMSDRGEVLLSLINLSKAINRRHIMVDSIAFPMLGCGCGGLDKKEMLSEMKNILSNIITRDVYIEIYYR